MKYIKTLLCLLICFFLSSSNVLAIDLNIQSKHAILYNMDTNEVLYEKSSSDKTSIASLTKLMTALVVVDHVKNLDEKVTLIPDDFKGLIEQNAVQAGFQVNERVTYRDLLYGLLLPSGADAAQALARLVAGDTSRFVEMMNEKAKQMNLKNTHFKNPTGLDSDNHYSTVKEVSTIFRETLKNNNLKTIMASKNYTTSNGKLNLKSTVLKFSSITPYLKGGKTGTTDQAGLCLASIASLKDVNLLLITTGAPYDKKGPHNFEDAKVIYDYFNKNYSNQVVVKKEDIVLELKTKYGKEDSIKFKLGNDIKAYLPNSIDKKDIIFKYNGIDIITPNMEQGKYLGTLDIYYKDKKLEAKEITLYETISFDITKYLNDHKIIYILGITCFIFIFFLIKRIFQKKNH